MNKHEIERERERIAKAFDEIQADLLNLRDSIDENVFPDAYAAAADLQDGAESYSDIESIEAELEPDDCS